MIDTDKYEGHTAGPWTAEYGDYTTHVTNSDGVVVASVGFESWTLTHNSSQTHHFS